MAVAGEAGKEQQEPHCDVMEALTGCWGVGRANLVVWRDGAGQIQVSSEYIFIR